MNVQNVTSFILAGTTVIGLFTSYALSRHGQREQSRQQAAANDLSQRAQSFTEMKELVEELKSDNGRLRQEIQRLEESSDRNLHRLGDRCRVALEHLAGAVATLQGVVVSEVARAAAAGAMQDADAHVFDDHGQHLEPTTPEVDT